MNECLPIHGQEPKPSSNLESTQEKNLTLPNGLPQLVTRRTLVAIEVLAWRKVTNMNVEHVLQDSRTRENVRGLQVTNDAVERGNERVALIQRFQTRTPEPKTSD